jgi:hypothetical protein
LPAGVVAVEQRADRAIVRCPEHLGRRAVEKSGLVRNGIEADRPPTTGTPDPAMYDAKLPSARLPSLTNA